MISFKKLVGISSWICICMYIFHQGRLLNHISFSTHSVMRVSTVNKEASGILSRVTSFKPFDPESPKLVLLLTYQRVGSTFTGQLFNLNDDVFYSFEPLDAMYTRLFGTKENWAVPIDIHFHWNGTYRHMLQEESKLMRQTIEQIFNCNYDNIIGEHLLHRFWQIPNVQQAARPYVECLFTQMVGLSKCAQHLEEVCPKRIGQDLHKEENCYKELNFVYKNGIKSSINEFNLYKECMNLQLDKVHQFCVPKLMEICNSKRVIAVKTVRLDMETVEGLVDIYPNLRIIHLLRDPKPVVLSRLKTEWAISGGTDSEIFKNMFKNPGEFRLKANSEEVFNIFKREAELYCYLAVKDIRKMAEIEQQHPGTTMQVIYERFIYYQQEEANRIYRFLGENIPTHISSWINKTSLPRGVKYGNEKIAHRWRSQMTDTMINAVDMRCQNLHQELNFVWKQFE